MSKRDFLNEAFHGKDSDEAQAFYDDWADTYEQTHTEMGYLAPKRCARALQQFVEDTSAPVLDIGCGTGLSGIALHDARFSHIVGTDLSSGMLEKAQQHKGVYSRLFQADLSKGVPREAGAFSHALAAGVYSPGHAPASGIELIVNHLQAQGCFSFSLNDHSLQDGRYEAAVVDLVKRDVVEEVFREHAINVPGTGLFATVIVLRKRDKR
ncbi:MAG: methyltransferase domain-containing protein [Pseudomonadota bacterium]